MLISCPFCGPRDEAEFTYAGAALGSPPKDGASAREWFAHAYLRDNPRGAHCELWQHTLGCRTFVAVERDTSSHAIASAAYAKDQD